MTDLDALYRAILDRPDDDTPRLVYADALDDAGQADRAGFVRAQVEAARGEPWAVAAIRVRCFRGGAPPNVDWVRELPTLPDGLDWAFPPFRRGFPALVQADSGGAFVAGADELFALAPVESLELSAARAADVAALAACPGLGRLKRLVIREGTGQATAHAVLNSPHLGALEDLSIGAGLTSARTAAAVVGSRAFGRLRGFSYRDDARGGAMVNALARVPGPLPLRDLALPGSRLDADGVRRLLSAPLVADLEALDLSDNLLGTAGFEALAEGSFPALRSLSAMRNGTGTAGIYALSAAPFAPELRVLNLGGNVLGVDAGTALAGLPLESVRVLDLRDNALGDDGVIRLLAAPWLGGVLHLDLADTGLGAKAAEALAAAPGLANVVALDVGRNPLPVAGRAALRERFGGRVLM